MTSRPIVDRCLTELSFRSDVMNDIRVLRPTVRTAIVAKRRLSETLEAELMQTGVGQSSVGDRVLTDRTLRAFTGLGFGAVVSLCASVRVLSISFIVSITTFRDIVRHFCSQDYQLSDKEVMIAMTE